MGFKPSRADQDLWIRKSDDHDGHDYVATHVDDILIAARDPSKYMTKIEQHFLVRDISDTPSYYLGNNLKQVQVQNKTYLHVSNRKYTDKVIR